MHEMVHEIAIFRDEAVRGGAAVIGSDDGVQIAIP